MAAAFFDSARRTSASAAWLLPTRTTVNRSGAGDSSNNSYTAPCPVVAATEGAVVGVACGAAVTSSGGAVVGAGARPCTELHANTNSRATSNQPNCFTRILYLPSCANLVSGPNWGRWRADSFRMVPDRWDYMRWQNMALPGHNPMMARDAVRNLCAPGC